MDDMAGEKPEGPIDRPSELDEGVLYKTIRDWFLGDAAHSAEWRKDAERNYRFVAGEQWHTETRKQMEEQKRPPITFNLTLSVIKAVAGLEINGRHETYFYPRGADEGDVVANELLNGCSKWMAQNCDAEDNQSSAFEDVLICGMGWTESRLDYEEEPEGKYIEEQCDPLEMYWDRSARAKNLADAQRMFRVKKMSLENARALAMQLGYKGPMEAADLNASWAIGYNTDGRLRSSSEDNPTKNASLDMVGSNDQKTDVYIVQAQWWEREEYFRVANPLTGQVEGMTAEELRSLENVVEMQNAAAVMMPHQPPMKVESVRQMRRVYKQAFLGGKMLATGNAPRDGFSWACITGQIAKMKGTWFGLVSLIRDPQMMANKWLSDATMTIASTAKGGIIAERGAFGPNMREAQKTYANPAAITFVEDGAIAKGKIMAKPGVGIATPYVQLMEYAIEAIWRATGMNQEILGMRDINQPGVLEQQRKQAAMTILATLFDSLRRYRKQIGRIRLYFIQNYLSDGRIIRIAGPNGMKAIRLVRDKTLGEYDVIVDDSPTSPNQKEQTFAMLMQLLPFFKENMTPEAAVIFLEYSPLPTEAVDKFKKVLLAGPSPEQQAQQALQVRGAQAQIAKDESAATKQRTSAILDLARAAQAQADASQKQLEGQISRQIIDGAAATPIETGREAPQLPMLPDRPPSPDAMDITDLVNSDGPPLAGTMPPA